MSFGVYMYYLAAAQQTSTVKLQSFFFRFQTEERVLKVNFIILILICFQLMMPGVNYVIYAMVAPLREQLYQYHYIRA